MAYPFVQAHDDYGPRSGPALAFVVHMAEGGGTVGFLSRPNDRGVSVHYVIEYTGRIVQMLLESHASGSLNPRDIRTTEGPPPFGISVARAVLGDWIRDPNAAVISLEIEGYAATGPNATQRAALVRLVDDVRSRHPSIGLLGHRDFQDYKRCPGALIPWADLGGHGPAAAEDTMAIYTRREAPGRLTIKAGTTVHGYKAVANGWAVAKTWNPHTADSPAAFRAQLARLSGTALPASLLEVSSGYFDGLYVSTAEVEEAFDPPPATVDCTAELAAQAAKVRAAIDGALG